MLTTNRREVPKCQWLETINGCSVRHTRLRYVPCMIVACLKSMTDNAQARLHLQPRYLMASMRSTREVPRGHTTATQSQRSSQWTATTSHVRNLMLCLTHKMRTHEEELRSLSMPISSSRWCRSYESRYYQRRGHSMHQASITRKRIQSRTTSQSRLLCALSFSKATTAH